MLGQSSTQHPDIVPPLSGKPLKTPPQVKIWQFLARILFTDGPRVSTF